MGQLMKILARELSVQEDILRCGYGSRQRQNSDFGEKYTLVYKYIVRFIVAFWKWVDPSSQSLA